MGYSSSTASTPPVVHSGHGAIDTAWQAVVCTAWLAMVLSVGLVRDARAQTAGAPGEDPISISRRVPPPSGPLASGPRSAPMTPPAVLPAWLDAKVARLTAKAWALDTRDLLTEKNLQAVASSDGMKKVCIQDIGSNIGGAADAAGNAAARGGADDAQIVVLKGDLINICR